MEDIRTQPRWGEATSEAYRLSRKLKDPTFLQLLEFFSMLMPGVDVCPIFCKNGPFIQLELAVLLFGSKGVLKI